MRFFTQILIILFLVHSVSAGVWQKQQSGVLAWLHGVYFLDEKRGFVVGANGTILTTTDGGANWDKTQKLGEDNLRDVFFADDKNGWLLAERSILKVKPGEARSYLFQTSDGGASWRRQEFPNNTNNTVVTKFVRTPDRKKVWAIGEVGTLYFYDGAAWQKQAAPTRYLLGDGAWIDANSGWLVGAGGSFMTTADGGKIWRENNFAGSPKLNAVFFSTSKIGWTAAAGGKIFATANGGRTWREQVSPTTADLLDIFFADEKNGWIVGDEGAILSTRSGGAAWTQERNGNSTRRIERLFFAGKSRGWAVGFGGTIYSYSN